MLHLDFESRSCIDLRKVGLFEYARHPSTDILCASYAFDDDPIKLWLPKDKIPAELEDHILSGGEVWAHNFAFECAIILGVCVPKYGWPSISPYQGVCTMAMAYAMGLPGSLENCAAALGVEERKDLVGGRLMLQYSKPRSVDPLIWWDNPEQLEKLYNYCRQDTVVERAIGKRMFRLSAYEKRVWNLDWRINNCGIAVDIPAVKNAIKLVSSEKERLNAEIQAISNGSIATCTAVQQIKDYLEFYGISGDALDKAAVAEHLSTNLDPVARRILELRAEAGKAATAKFLPMVESSGEDGRVRGCFQFSGANTRRWAGRRIQLHNLKRLTIPFSTIESVIEEIRNGASAEEISLCFGPPLSILSECVRSFLIAAPGHELIVADFNAIEARVLAWLAGQESVLNVFREGKDVYKSAAAAIFGVPEDKVTDDQRQVGKVAILALGYGGGVGAFQTMAKGYGVRMEPAYEYLWGIATPDQRVQAEERHKSALKKFEEISQKEFIASELTKIFWRNANPEIVRYWYALEEAATSATLRPGEILTVNNIRFKKTGSFLWCQLPGGGVICYPYPEIKKVKTPWGQEKNAFTYMAEDGQTHEWKRFNTYGGSLAENITQAVSRDILADAMLRLDASGYKIVSHVHDEIICEMPKGKGQLQTMVDRMVELPIWAKDLPIAAKGYVSQRYRK